MPRTTSRIAYKNINEDGTSGNQRLTIFNAVYFNNGQDEEGMSLREISAITGYEINAVSGRVNELKKDNYFKECPKRKCKVSRRLITPVRSASKNEYK